MFTFTSSSSWGYFVVNADLTGKSIQKIVHAWIQIIVKKKWDHLTERKIFWHLIFWGNSFIFQSIAERTDIKRIILIVIIVCGLVHYFAIDIYIDIRQMVEELSIEILWWNLELIVLRTWKRRHVRSKMRVFNLLD